MIREWANSMVCGNIIDHEEIDGSDRYWIEPYRMRALCDTAFSSELFTATVETLGLVENCYPLDGPPGMCTNTCNVSASPSNRYRMGKMFTVFYPCNALTINVT